MSRYLDFAGGTVGRATPRSISARSTGSPSVACGTAYIAGLIGKYWFERYARLPVDIDIASEFRYREMPLSTKSAAMFVSQSGETADTLASLRYCKENGLKIGAMVNVQESTIAREADVVFPTLAGPEIGVASTKAFTCQLAVLASLAVAAGEGARNASVRTRSRRRCSRAAGGAPAHDRRPVFLPAADRDTGARPVEIPPRPLSRPWHEFSAGHGRRAEAQGNFLYPCRRLSRPAN